MRIFDKQFDDRKKKKDKYQRKEQRITHADTSTDTSKARKINCHFNLPTLITTNQIFVYNMLKFYLNIQKPVKFSKY